MDRSLSSPLFIFIFVTLATLLTVIAASGCGDPAPERSESLASRIELAAGNVSVKQGPKGKWELAVAGLLLRHGTQVKVGSGDRALIRMDDGSAVFLRHGTQVELAPGGLQLAVGEVWVDAPPQDKEPVRYSAGKVSVSASAAGLDIRRSANEVEIYVARGLAVVSAPGGRTELQSGQKAVVRGAGGPRVTPVAFWEDWTGGMADRTLRAGVGGAGTGRIYAINRGRPGSPPQELEVRAQYVRVLVRDGVARTIVDQRFFNPTSTPVEGYYWFTVPEGAAVDRFALEVSSTLVDGEVIERKQARAAYEASIRQAIDPALLEWVDGRTYRARIFPIPAAGERRVVLSYLELLPTVDNRIHYVYPMGGAGTRVQEFALEVDLGKAGEEMKLATTADARIEGKGRKVTMRRSGFKPQGDFLLEMTVKGSAPLRAMRVESSRGEASYVALRYVPDVGWGKVKEVPGHVVVVVDTSAGGDDADRQLRSDVAEAILRALSTSDRFALVAADLTPRVLYPDKGLAPADEANVGKALERLSGVSRGGATDLGAVFDVALKRLHKGVQPAVVYVGDGQPTVGEVEGERLAGRVTRSMAGSSARLFTIAAGSRCNHALLERLSRIGGGRSFRVDVAQQAVQEALRFVGSLKTPTITELKLDVGAGLDQVFMSSAGKVSRGQEVTLLARTHHSLPEEVKVTGRLGGEAFSKSYKVKTRTGREVGYVPKLWARRYLTHLLGTDRQKNRGTIIRLGVDYSLMTPFTSFLVLESDAAYQRFGIQRRARDPQWGIVPHAALMPENIEGSPAVPFGLFGCSRSAPERSVGAAPAPSPTLAKEMPAPPPPRQSQALDRMPGGYGGKAEPAVTGSTLRSKATVSRRPRPAKRPADPEPARDEASRGAEDGDAEEQKPVVVLRICSDAARRPLAHRQAIWRHRLARASGVSGYVAVYRQAQSSCELPHWRDRRALLDLVQQRVRTAAEVRTLLGSIADAKGREFVRRRLLRRAVSQAMNAALGGGDSIDWSIVEGTLPKLDRPAQRVAALQKLCAEHPRSQGCMWRLIKAMVASGRHAEALGVALRMRTDGLATPALMQQIGDLLAGAGRSGEAKRVYSEIVEFSPEDPAARRLLGDIYLRHSWYESAYRQYKTLTEDRRTDALGLMRLAAAASGTGRVDEALRLERRVAAGEGEPGPKDPRRWARLWSAARIARLMLSASGGEKGLKRSMERSLRRLQVVSRDEVLVVVTWEDLSVPLSLDLEAGGKALSWADRVPAGAAGLLAVRTRTAGLQLGQLTARIRRSAGAEARGVSIQLTVIRWDGKQMRVANDKGKVDKEPLQLSVRVP